MNSFRNRKAVFINFVIVGESAGFVVELFQNAHKELDKFDN